MFSLFFFFFFCCGVLTRGFRNAVDLSDVEDMPVTKTRYVISNSYSVQANTRFSRTSDEKEKRKTINAVGHTSEVTLKMRDSVNKAQQAGKRQGTQRPAQLPVDVDVEAKKACSSY